MKIKVWADRFSCKILNTTPVTSSEAKRRHCRLLPTASSVIPVTATQAGYVKKIDALSIGIAAMKLGAGRATKEDTIDMGVGIVLNKKVGESIQVGDVLAYVHTNQSDSQEAIDYIMKAYEITSSSVCSPTLIYDIIS